MYVRLKYTNKSKYGNWLIAKQMLMWREERRVWLSSKQQAGDGSISSGGLIH